MHEPELLAAVLTEIEEHGPLTAVELERRLEADVEAGRLGDELRAVQDELAAAEEEWLEVAEAMDRRA